MKTTFTNDEFKKLIEAEIYVAFIYGAAFDCDTMYEDNEGRSCLAFIIEDDDEYIFPWDDIKEITFNTIFRTFTIFMKDGSYQDEIRLLTSYVPQWLTVNNKI